MQLVLEFGSIEPQPVLRQIKLAVGQFPYDTESLAAATNTYAPMGDTLESAELKLAGGQISAFSLRPRGGLIRYALVLRPHFEGEAMSLYMGTVEYLGRDYAQIWSSLLADPELSFACIGYEEGVGLSDSQLSVDTFPWGSWPLIVGALRSPTSSQPWVVREGPAKRALVAAPENGSAR